MERLLEPLAVPLIEPLLMALLVEIAVEDLALGPEVGGRGDLSASSTPQAILAKAGV